MKIHPTAVVSPRARLGTGVEIGPYSIIEDEVTIGDNCYIDAHVKIAAYTTVGDNCRIYYGALIGEEPQDRRFSRGLVSYTEIGAGTVIREYVTIHRPPFEGQKTLIGKNVLLMSFVHVGHDAIIADQVTVANQTALSGHVQLDVGAIVSGYVLMHQFCHVGTLAMVGAGNMLVQDVPPYCLMEKDGYICGPNTVGLRRSGMTPEQRGAIRRAIKLFFFNGLNTRNAVEKILEGTVTPEVRHFVDFVTNSTRGIVSGNPHSIVRHDVADETESEKD